MDITRIIHTEVQTVVPARELGIYKSVAEIELMCSLFPLSMHSTAEVKKHANLRESSV